jgi:ammonia channel protein AmtB
VAICAGCAAVDYYGAAIIGLIAGVVVVFGAEFVEKKLKIDDPVGAFAVHGLSGIVGILSVGFLANPDASQEWRVCCTEEAWTFSAFRYWVCWPSAHGP